jgi:hypothetical protein
MRKNEGSLCRTADRTCESTRQLVAMKDAEISEPQW